MAVRFDAGGEYYQSSSVPSANVYTVLLWVYLSGAQGAWAGICTVHDGTSVSRTLQMHNTTGNLSYFENIGSSEQMTAIANDTWTALAITRTATAATIYYGTNPAALGSTGISVTSLGAPTTLTLGVEHELTSALNGRIANVKTYGATLTAAEVALELAQFVPVRTANLERWHPFLATDTADYSGNARTLTGGSGASTEDGPPIPWDSSETILTVPAGAAATNANAGLATANATGFGATVTTSPNVSAGHGSAHATGLGATVNVSVDAGLASANATGRDATVTTSPNVSAGHGSAHATGQTPTANVSPNAGHASANATALDATVTTSPNVSAGHASAHATGQGATVSISVNAGHASANATGRDPSTTQASNATAGLATANATGLDATTSTDGQTSVNAGHASAHATGRDATVTTSPNVSAGLANAHATGLGATVSVSVNAGLASANATGRDATTSTEASSSANAGHASAHATALIPSTTQASNATAGHASANAAAQAPTASVSPAAGAGGAQATAYDPLIIISPSAGHATANATGHAATIGLDGDVDVDGGVATAWARAFSPTLLIHSEVGGNWRDLQSILADARDLARAYATQRPVACECGEPLRTGPRGTLFCMFDGTRY